MIEWIEQFRQAYKSQQPFILITVAKTGGSTPREAGSKMMVSNAESWGTIGGGNLEYQACQNARKLLHNKTSGHIQRYSLGTSLGQCCGGYVEILFELVTQDDDDFSQWQVIMSSNQAVVRLVNLDDPKYPFQAHSKPALTDHPQQNALIRFAKNMFHNRQITALQDFQISGKQTSYYIEWIKPTDFNIVVFGGGHVGQSVMHILSTLDCNLTWIENRPDQFIQKDSPAINYMVTESPENEVCNLAPGSYYLVLTHDHALDYRITQAILDRDDFVYFGLIGSQTKRKKFEHRLIQQGVKKQKLNTMNCPVGIDVIEGKSPAVVALSICAELQQVYESHQRSMQSTSLLKQVSSS